MRSQNSLFNVCVDINASQVCEKHMVIFKNGLKHSWVCFPVWNMLNSNQSEFVTSVGLLGWTINKWTNQKDNRNLETERGDLY